MKKGFTLIEMLAVIVVLSLIMTIAIRSIGAVRTNQLKKIAEEKVHNIEKAAVLYAQENPSLFDTAAESTKCSNSNYNEATMPGISDYKNYEDCIIVAAMDLATNNYLNCDYENNKYVLKNDYTGENMLDYYVAIYRSNNRVNAFVSVKENQDLTEGYVLSQKSVPQGGIYSSCTTDRYKILTKEGSKDVYKCGLGVAPRKSQIITEENGQQKRVCPTDFVLVFGNEEYCCAKNNMVFIDNYCVSVKADLLTKPTCPNSTDYELSDNYNLCTYTRTVTESTCATGTKMLANGKYYCLTLPKCGSGYELSYDYKYCTKTGSATIESTCAIGNKTYANDKYYCLKEPTCAAGREMSFDLNYCE